MTVIEASKDDRPRSTAGAAASSADAAQNRSPSHPPRAGGPDSGGPRWMFIEEGGRVPCPSRPASSPEALRQTHRRRFRMRPSATASRAARKPIGRGGEQTLIWGRLVVATGASQRISSATFGGFLTNAARFRRDERPVRIRCRAPRLCRRVAALAHSHRTFDPLIPSSGRGWCVRRLAAGMAQAGRILRTREAYPGHTKSCSTRFWHAPPAQALRRGPRLGVCPQSWGKKGRAIGHGCSLGGKHEVHGAH